MRTIKRLIIILSLVTLAGGLFGGGIALGTLARQNGLVSPLSAPSVKLKQDPRLLRQASNVGLDTTNLNLVFGDIVGANVDDAMGGFIAPNTIILKEGLTKKEIRTILAHEYIHYQWTLMDDGVRDSVVEVYERLQKDDPWIKQRLNDYHHCDTECMANEATAYSCTELAPYRLTEEYNDFCNQFITNRKVLFQ